MRVLATIRREQGYIAESVTRADGSILLRDNHCPICVAAKSCQGLCREETRALPRSARPPRPCRAHRPYPRRRFTLRLRDHTDRLDRDDPAFRATRLKPRETDLPFSSAKSSFSRSIATVCTRAVAITPIPEAGLVWLPDKTMPASPWAPEGYCWVDDYEHELELFPAGKLNDRVETFVHAITYLRSQGSVVDFWRRLQATSGSRGGTRCVQLPLRLLLELELRFICFDERAKLCSVGEYFVPLLDVESNRESSKTVDRYGSFFRDLKAHIAPAS